MLPLLLCCVVMVLKEISQNITFKQNTQQPSPKLNREMLLAITAFFSEEKGVIELRFVHILLFTLLNKSRVK